MENVYLIGCAHIDPAWLWQWQEGYTEVRTTFRSALDRMKEFPFFKFTSACSAYYAWIKESDPAMYEEIRERVKEGRWTIAGGWVIQPDCNMPSGESFARHGLISQRFFEREFGIRAKTGWNVDSFGHNAAIPMILKQSGMENYVFMRPMEHEKANLPDSLFNWVSPDGSSARTYRVPFTYHLHLGWFEHFEKIAAMADKHPMMGLFGIGNHGGGPTIGLLTKMQAELDERFVYASPEEFFAAVGEGLPAVTEDLQFHATGCYTACSLIKNLNRRSESELGAAENLSALSAAEAGTPYPADELTRAWKVLLFNQFHDILGGCSIRAVYDDAAAELGGIRAAAARAVNFACQQISRRIDTQGNVTALDPVKTGVAALWKTPGLGTPVVVFNPHPWETTRFVQIRSRAAVVRDEAGEEIPSQTVRAPRTNGAKDKWETGFLVTLPALGWKMVCMCDGEEPSATDIPEEENVLENDLLKIRFDDKTGEIASILEKTSGKELLAAPTQTVLMDETAADTWGHGIKEYQTVAETISRGQLKRMENGPVRFTMRVTQTGERSVIRRDYSLTRGSDLVTVKVKIDFHEHHRMLKFRFPVNAASPRAWSEIPFGPFERPTDGSEQVCHRYMVMTDGDGHGGLAVLNDGKYGFDAKENVLSQTVLRGAMWADHYGERDEWNEYMEQGENELTYAIEPFRSYSETSRHGAELNQPPFTVIEGFHKGELPAEKSGISVSADNILVTAVKKHEDSDAFVLRAAEVDGQEAEAEIELFGRRFAAHFAPRAVKTFIVGADGARETDFLEE